MDIANGYTIKELKEHFSSKRKQLESNLNRADRKPI